MVIDAYSIGGYWWLLMVIIFVANVISINNHQYPPIKYSPISTNRILSI